MAAPDIFNGSYNLTEILNAFDQLTEAEKEQLYRKGGVSGYDEFMCLLQSPTCNHQDTLTEDPLMKYDAYRLHKSLILYVPPIMLIIGTIGNILSFVILTRKAMRKLSTYTYLAVLSMTDLMILYVGLLRLWVGELTGKDVRDHAAWMCKAINVFGYTVSDYSVWLIIAMTFERWIAVCMPLKAPSMCNRRRAVVVIVAIFILLLTLNLHFFWTTEIRNYTFKGKIKPQCDSGEPYEKLVLEIWPWVDAFIYSFFPFVVIVTLNGLIIHKVLISKKERYGLNAASGGNRVDKVAKKRPNRSGHGESSTKLTVMLLTISFTFLITTLPMNVLLIVKALITGNISMTVGAKMQLARSITELLMYMNHSMNFFLYCATGEKFRQQLLQLICPHRGHAANPLRWHSEFSQGYTEKTALNHGLGTLNSNKIRSKHGPCKSKNCPLTPGAINRTTVMSEDHVPLTKLSFEGLVRDQVSPVPCRVDYQPSGNHSDSFSGNPSTTCKVDYSRIKSEGEV